MKQPCTISPAFLALSANPRFCSIVVPFDTLSRISCEPDSYPTMIRRHPAAFILRMASSESVARVLAVQGRRLPAAISASETSSTLLLSAEKVSSSTTISWICGKYSRKSMNSSATWPGVLVR